MPHICVYVVEGKGSISYSVYTVAPHIQYSIVLYCIVLYCIVLYCIVLYCIVLYCIVLYCIVMYSNVRGKQYSDWYMQYTPDSDCYSPTCYGHSLYVQPHITFTRI